MVQRRSALLVCALLLTTALVPNSLSTSSGDPEIIGEYKWLGLFHDLTEDHVTSTAEGLRIEPPTLANHLHVDEAWLEASLGPWASDVEFVRHADGMVEFADFSVHVEPFVPGEEPRFTFGSAETISFPDAPTWVSISAVNISEIRLDFDANDPVGSTVLIGDSFLRALGIHRPNITAPDGSVVPWARVDYLNETTGEVVPGISINPDDLPDYQFYPAFVLIRPAEIDVRGRQGGFFVPPDEYRWMPSEKRLEIDVDPKVNDYEVWLEVPWVEVNLPNVGLRGFQWVMDGYEDTEYFVVKFDAAETGTTIVFEEFYPDQTPTFTQGLVSSVFVYGLNASHRDSLGPTFLAVEEQFGEVRSTVSSSVTNLAFNRSYLSSIGIDIPIATNELGAPVDLYLSHDRHAFFIPQVNGTTVLRAGGHDYAQEIREAVATIEFDLDLGILDVLSPGYSEFGENGLRLRIRGVPWNQSYNGSDLPVNRVAVQVSGVVHASGTVEETVRIPVPDSLNNSSFDADLRQLHLAIQGPIDLSVTELVFQHVGNDSSANGGSGESQTDIDTFGLTRDLLVNDPLVNSLLDSNGSNHCTTDVWLGDSILDGETNGNSYSSAKSHMSASSKWWRYEFSNSCSETCYSNRAPYCYRIGNDWSFGVRGKTQVSGGADYVFDAVTQIDGAYYGNPFNTYDYEDGMEAYTFNPSIAVGDKHAQMTNRGIGTEIQRRWIECTYTDDPFDWVDSALIWAMQQIPYAGWAIPSQSCAQTVEPIVGGNDWPQWGPVTLHGGLNNIGTYDDDGAGILTIFNIPGGDYTLPLVSQGRVEIERTFKGCYTFDDGRAGCEIRTIPVAHTMWIYHKVKMVN